ncbi:hypothetical protein WM008_19720 [Vibrio vulnificus]|uniref:hypothetical protein n=1 Tax=Vibrio vulnificus TaxID=672 RepID=UPI000C99A6B1|nr:hypothetical protein [Vibrio vulnificus]PNG70673.1 hypothetical protein TI06_19945 [Vibrio vulnificus]
MNMKTLRMVGMGILAISMASWLAVDFLSSPNTPLISSDGPTEIFSEPVHRTEDVVATLVVEEVVSPKPANAQPVETTPPIELNVVSTTKPNAPVVTFTLSNRAQAVLNALEETYLSQVTDAKLTAQIAAQQRQDTLDQLTQEAIIIEHPAVPLPLSSLDRLTVKSIVSTPKRITAWVELNGQTVPIQHGAWVEDVKALNITKDFVQFIDKQGRTLTKYVETVLPTVSEKNDGKSR